MFFASDQDRRCPGNIESWAIINVAFRSENIPHLSVGVFQGVAIAHDSPAQIQRLLLNRGVYSGERRH